MTKLERGIILFISDKEFEKLENDKKFLSYSAYPEEYKKIAIYSELGRMFIFRFFPITQQEIVLEELEKLG